MPERYGVAAHAAATSSMDVGIGWAVGVVGVVLVEVSVVSEPPPLPHEAMPESVNSAAKKNYQ